MSGEIKINSYITCNGSTNFYTPVFLLTKDKTERNKVLTGKIKIKRKRSLGNDGSRCKRRNTFYFVAKLNGTVIVSVELFIIFLALVKYLKKTIRRNLFTIDKEITLSLYDEQKCCFKLVSNFLLFIIITLLVSSATLYHLCFKEKTKSVLTN